MDSGKRMVRRLIFVTPDSNNPVGVLENFGAERVIKRAHSNCLELDFSLSEDKDTVDLKKQLTGFISECTVVEEFANMTTQEKLQNADLLIEEERFWEAHNILENIWKESTGASKQLIHDVIGIIVSQIKVQMNQKSTGKKVYMRNINLLRKSGPAEFIEQLPESFTYPLRLHLSVLSKVL